MRYAPYISLRSSVCYTLSPPCFVRRCIHAIYTIYTLHNGPHTLSTLFQCIQRAKYNFCLVRCPCNAIHLFVLVQERAVAACACSVCMYLSSDAVRSLHTLPCLLLFKQRPCTCCHGCHPHLAPPGYSAFCPSPERKQSLGKLRPVSHHARHRSAKKTSAFD